jgi:hypothetical protein
MKTVKLETPIAAPAEVVWEVLADLARYGEWNPFITSIEGDLSPGAELRATFLLPGRKPRTFTPTVTAVEPGKRISWLGRLWLPGLVDAAHSLEITIGTAGPVFVHREDFRGLLVPALGGLVRDTHAAFAAMNVALALRAERLYAVSVGHQLGTRR